MITVTKIWLTEDAVWIRTSEGKEACEYYVDYPRLRYASPEQRSHYSVDVVWISEKYRLLFKTSPDENGIIVNAILTEISKHYE